MEYGEIRWYFFYVCICIINKKNYVVFLVEVGKWNRMLVNVY